MIQNIIWRHYVKTNIEAGVAFCTKDEFPDYTGSPGGHSHIGCH